jgi:hypothetical protein
MALRTVYYGGDISTGTEIEIDNNWTIQEKINVRSTFTFKIIDDNGVTVRILDEIYMYEGTEKLWGGVIKTITDYQVGNTTDVHYECVAEDFSELLHRTLCNKSYDDKSIEYIIESLIDNYFNDYGITMGNIDASTILTRVRLVYRKGDSALEDYLKKFGNYIWYVDKDKKLHFHLISYTTSSTALSGYEGLKRNRNGNNYRNYQYVKGRKRYSPLQSNETPTSPPNGVNREFFVKYEIAKEPAVEINRGSGWISQTIGLKGIDDGNAQWYWNYQSTQLTHDENETVLATGNQVRVTYYGLIPLIVATYNTAEVARVGKYQEFIYDGDLDDASDAIKYSNQLLSQYANEADTLTFKLQSKTYEIATQFPVNISTPAINDTFFVESITWKPRGVDAIDYNYTVLDGVALGGWEEFFRSLVQLDEIEVDDNEIVIQIESISEQFNWAGEYDIEQQLPLYPSTTLYPSNTLYPGSSGSSYNVSD